MHAADASAYTQQLSGGFALLRFEQQLEREFRAYYSARNLPLVRIALTLGLVFVGGMSLLAAYPGRLARFADRLFPCTGAAISGGSVALLWLDLEYAVTPDYSGIVVITYFST